jgi:hypothetical protein
MIEITGPVWVDGCNHPKEAYVSSFKSLHFKPEIREEKYDLYVFDQPSGQSVCIRFGNEPQEYYSPPAPLIRFIQHAAQWDQKVPQYSDALVMLNEKGVFSWKKSINVDSAQQESADGQTTLPP